MTKKEIFLDGIQKRILQLQHTYEIMNKLPNSFFDELPNSEDNPAIAFLDLEELNNQKNEE